MDKIVIEGGKPLKGEVQVSGAKNAALPILAAALLAPGESIMRNVPDLQDVRTFTALLRFLGARTSVEGSVVHIDASTVNRPEAPYELVKQMRASVLVLGPLLARFGKAKVSLPGGCAIGARPINLHLKGLEAMGARISLERGYVIAEADRLKGAEINFDISTHTGTENLMMAATLAKGRTVLINAAREPEVEELARILNKMGARISGAGTNIIEIEGTDDLEPFDHAIMADRIEAGTFLVAGCLPGSDIIVKGCLPEHLGSVISKLGQSGVDVEPTARGIRVRGTERPEPVDITTAPYPGFPTDMQAQFMVLMCLSSGQSLITETVFENRFMHVSELQRMGADISVRGRSAIIRGQERLCGAQVMATDLRASASLVLAGLAAENTTEVLRVYHIDRGYERIEEKLGKLGCRVKRVAGSA